MRACRMASLQGGLPPQYPAGRQNRTVVRESGISLPRSTCQHYHFLAVWPWTYFWASVSSKPQFPLLLNVKIELIISCKVLSTVFCMWHLFLILIDAFVLTVLLLLLHILKAEQTSWDGRKKMIGERGYKKSEKEVSSASWSTHRSPFVTCWNRFPAWDAKEIQEKCNFLTISFLHRMR